MHAYIYRYIHACIDTCSFFFAGCLLRSYAASGAKLRRGALTAARLVFITYIYTYVRTLIHTQINTYVSFSWLQVVCCALTQR